MPYYRGDYFRSARGDFYQGDPGFFSFLSGAAKSLVGAIPGVGPALASIIPSGAAKAAAPAVGTLAARAGTAVKAIRGGIMKHPVLSAAGAAGIIGAGAGALRSSRGMVAPMGAVGGFAKRHRRMRVTNPKALRRAIRRATGFTKLAMRTIHLIHPRKKARFGGFKKRVRR